MADVNIPEEIVLSGSEDSDVTMEDIVEIDQPKWVKDKFWCYRV